MRDYFEAVRFFLFVTRIVAQADEGRVRAAKALAVGASPEEAARYQETIDKPDLVLGELKKFSTVQSRNLVLSATNSFLCYFSEIIQSAIAKRPEILSSSQSIRLEELMSFKRYSDVVTYLVDKRVNELSYGGMLKMEEYMRERLGINSFHSEDQKNLLLIYVELRNIITHNRGVVNDVFLSIVKNHMDFKFTKGRAFHCDLDHFSRLSANCIEVACGIDAAVCEKFGIQRKRYATWQSPQVKL